jgi:hypothetical protein
MSLNHLAIVVTTSPVYQGYAAFFTLTAYSSVDNSVIDTAYTGTVSFSSETLATFYDVNNPDVPITSYTFTTQDQGVHNFAIISDVLGAQTIIVGEGELASFTVVAGAPNFEECCQMSGCQCQMKSDSDSDSDDDN